MKTKHVSRRFRRFAWANEAVSALELRDPGRRDRGRDCGGACHF